MLKEEEFEFCVDNAVSIMKFLREYFAIKNYESKKNNKNRRWKIKHSELIGWPNLIKVPIPFAIRYKELVKMGKLIIVRDDFGVFKVYINPILLTKSYELRELKEKLSALDVREISGCEMEFLNKKMADLEEDVRIVEHFHGKEYLDSTTDIINALEGVKLVRQKH